MNSFDDENNNFYLITMLMIGTIYIVYIIGNLKAKSTQELLNQSDLIFLITMAILGLSLILLNPKNITSSKFLLFITIAIVFIYSHFESIKENSTLDLTLKTIAILTTFVTVIWTNANNIKLELINNLVSLECSLIFSFIFNGLFKWLFILIDVFLSGYLFFILSMITLTFNNLKSLLMLLFFIVSISVICTHFCPNASYKLPKFNIMSIILFITSIFVSFLFNNFYTENLNFETIKKGKVIWALIMFIVGLLLGGLLFVQYGVKLMDYWKMNLMILLVFFALFFLRSNILFFIKNQNIINFIINAINYIPCLFYGGKNESMPKNWPALFWVAAIVFGYLIFYFSKKIFNKTKTAIQKMGGKSLNNANTTLDLNIKNNLGVANENHGYAISMWIFINSNNDLNNNYSEIFNFGNNPTVNYNVFTNTLQFTCKINKNEHKLMDSSETKEVYIQKNVLLQKWINILFNFNNGTLDIFYDGQLVKSVPNVVPYKSLDEISAGSSINGGIKDIYYFDKPLNQFTISIITNPIIQN